MPWLGCWVYAGALIWLIILLLPWRPWSTRERLDSASSERELDLSDLVVLVPARNEARVLSQSLRALGAQGSGLKIVVVDDQSTDGTGSVARSAPVSNLVLVQGKPLPHGWTGKLWALEQGKPYLDRPLTLLMDADVELLPGLISRLRKKLQQERAGLVSLMVQLSTATFWERLLLPAFIYFFKLLYPFRLANTRASRVAAAAGGCILIETRLLLEVGAFASFRNALIDDCMLARRVKDRGYRTWIGLTRSAISRRPHGGLGPLWRTVVRTAFTQLRYSYWWLLLCTILMGTAFVAPLFGFLATSVWINGAAGFAYAAMAMSYLPALRFYGLPGYFALALPIIGGLYLLMTWHSAFRYSRGEHSRWKGRAYTRTGAFCEDCRDQ